MFVKNLPARPFVYLVPGKAPVSGNRSPCSPHAAIGTTVDVIVVSFLATQGILEYKPPSPSAMSPDTLCMAVLAIPAYVTKLDIKFEHLELIDIPSIVKNCTDQWFNQTLTKVNNSVVRIGIIQGEYHWHKHDHDDEFFFVLEGQLLIDLEDKTVALNPNQGMTISKGIMHRTRAPEKTVILMVENSTIQPTGD